MKSIWNLANDPICREAGEYLFIFQMQCLRDWKKVVHQGPWTFRGWGILIEDYDGLSDPADFVFDGMHVWAQIHGIPELYRKFEVVDDLARRVGQVKEVQMSPKLFFEGNYVRLRVRININKALARFVSLTLPEGKKRLPIKYEKIPFFCKRCGLIGHDHEECGDGVWEEKQLQYGTWMLAIRRTSQPILGPRRFASRTPTRGGFAGRGEADHGQKKRNSQDAALDDSTEDETKDTASSPIKTSDLEEPMEEDVDPKTKKGLQFADEVQTGTGNVGGAGASTYVIPPPPPQYVNPKDRAKSRKVNDRNTENLAPSAASSVEDRRA
jgi:hypothetical protein